MGDLKTRQYIGQQKAIEEFKNGLFNGRKGTLFNMGMGTGKTRTAIECVKYLRNEIVKPLKKTLIVVIACPCALLPEPKAINPGGWYGELKKWYSNERGEFDGYQVYMERKGTTRERAASMVDLLRVRANGYNFAGVPLVIGQSYDSWRQPELAKLLQSIGKTSSFYKLLICDESHRCKGYNTSTTKTMHKFSAMCDQTLLLTGTPMPHTPMDMWAQGMMVYPSAYGASFFAFRSRYANMRQLQGRQQMFVGMKREKLPEFKERMDMFTYSLTVEDALDLPPLTHNTIHVSMSAKEQKAYDQMKKEMIAEIQLNKDLGEVVAANVLSQIGKLSQITGGSIKAEDGSVVRLGTSKADALEELLREDISNEEPVVVFCRFKADLDRVHEVAANVGRKSYELSGRCKQLEPWRAATDGSVIAVQESAGGVGISLVRARHIIYYSVGYSLGGYEQSLARVYRAGQEFPVSAIHLVCPGTIDDIIRESITTKRNMVNAALGYLGFEDLEEMNRQEPDDWSDLLGDD